MKSVAVSARVVLVAVLVGANAWLAASTIEPLQASTAVNIVLVLRSTWQLFLSCGACALGLSATVYLCARRGVAVPLGPLLLLALPLVAVGLLATPLRSVAGPWLFLFVDLRWWFFGTVAALQFLAVDAAIEHRWTRRLREGYSRVAANPRSTFWFELAMVVALAVPALVASPAERFRSSLTGDEPKYVRFMENWYRGQGFDISVFPPIDQLPVGQPPQLAGNVRRFGSASVQLGRDLTSDARRLVGLTAPARAGGPTSRGGWFVAGKRGGVYQVHNPGLSALLFPGYLIDRYLLNRTSEIHPQFPTNLYATSASLLVLYLFWGVALFRLLWASTGDRAVAWLLAWIAMMSLPATAFSFQDYPEVAAGLALTLLVAYASRPMLTSGATALLYGFLAGFLPWLHLRFGPAAFIVALAVLLHRERSTRAVLGFVCGFAVPLAALALYGYHISGSLFPWALYSVIPDSPGFSAARVLYDLPRFWFDSQRGLIAHAPIYLFALPGFLLFSRRQPRQALLIAAVAGSVAVLSAAHGWGGGDSTPLRLVAAVAPFLFLPAADALLATRSSRWCVALFAVLAVVSVQNGLTYNRYVLKASQYLLMSGPSVSGWKTPLLLPSTEPANAASFLFAVWVALTLALTAAPFWLSRPRRPQAVKDADHGRFFAWTVVTAAVVAVCAASGSAAAALTGSTFDPHYLPDSSAVRDELLRPLLEGKRGLTLVTGAGRLGRMDLPAIFPNAVDATITTRPAVIVATVDTPVTLLVGASDSRRQIAWGIATVDFGDRSAPQHTPLIGRAPVTHTYRSTGDFAVTIDLVGPGPIHLQRTVTAHVGRPAIDGQR